MPATGKDMNTGDITQLEPNIHAGVKYISLMRDKFFGSQPMDARNKLLFAFAAYNAGPGKILKLQKTAEKCGLNPYVWFNNVEVIAGERIGEETVTYVSNINKYFVAYKLVEKHRAEKEKTRRELLQRVSTPQ
jgi:membrane-bound lytic murein transglycosylase MltF